MYCNVVYPTVFFLHQCCVHFSVVCTVVLYIRQDHIYCSFVVITASYVNCTLYCIEYCTVLGTALNQE